MANVDVDDRFIGFHFTEEPTNTVAQAGRVELNCQYAAVMKNIASRIEWRKDGAEMGTLQSTGKVWSSVVLIKFGRNELMPKFPINLIF
ncbi:unnamed protein product [Litomosoides sigmodontis]|uniref:Ig-like domain-containing protein n=1 Tax=Litomosoides sigmodontis TaxID=42156 RepID=A0A3P6SWT8_LITSI|nr:unnamed protein product [Litomosoides sigmodontis]